MPVERMTTEQDEKLMEELDNCVEDPTPVIHGNLGEYSFVQGTQYSRNTFTQPNACVSAAMMHSPPDGECHHKTLIVNTKMGASYHWFAQSMQCMVRCPKCNSEPLILLSNAFIGEEPVEK